jgi:hypothetical protein
LDQLSDDLVARIFAGEPGAQESVIENDPEPDLTNPLFRLAVVARIGVRLHEDRVVGVVGGRARE